MFFLNLYLLIVLIIYLSAFFIQNIRTYFSVKQSIRGRSVKLTISLVVSTCIYILTFAQLASPVFFEKLFPIDRLDFQTLDVVGSVFITLALIIGLAALYEMKNSWRVGIKYDQKTALVTTGIYSISRNPYFLSYDLLFAGIFLIFPTVVLLLLIIGVVVTFHYMILEEERYLRAVQGEEYEFYKEKTGRYLLRI